MAIIGVSGRLHGSPAVLRALNKAIKEIEGDLSDGFDRALAYARRKAIQKTPKEYGDLRKSIKVDKSKSTRQLTGRVYSTYPTAPLVHEAKGLWVGKQIRRRSMKGNYWDPSGEPKFLEKAFTENHKYILLLISKRAKR